MAQEVSPLSADEVLLFPKPGFLVGNVMFISIFSVYNRENGFRLKSLADFYKELPSQSFLDARREEIRLEHEVKKKQILDEYNSTLTALRLNLGTTNIRLINLGSTSTHEEFGLKEEIVRMDKAFDFEFQSVSFRRGGERLGVYPRDIFSRVGEYVFVNIPTLPLFSDVENVIYSPLGEGGSVLTVGESVLISDGLKKYPSVQGESLFLRSRGYKVAFVPTVKPRGQAADKQDYVGSHIDGHSSLVVGKDGRNYFLFASSYAHQDKTSYNRLINAADQTNAVPMEVDDTSLSHLAFNFIQLRDGSLVYSPTGRSGQGGYQTSELDKALISIVGYERIIFLPKLELTPYATRAGLRCLTNIATRRMLESILAN